MTTITRIVGAGATADGADLVLQYRDEAGAEHDLHFHHSIAGRVLHGLLIAVQKGSENRAQFTPLGQAMPTLQSLLPVDQVEFRHLPDGLLAMQLTADGAPLGFRLDAAAQAAIRATLCGTDMPEPDPSGRSSDPLH